MKKMRICGWTVWAMIVGAPVVAAQAQPPPERPEAPRAGQPPRPPGFGPPERMIHPSMVDDLLADLDLDEEQRKAARSVAREVQKQFMERLRTSADLGAKRRELLEKMRLAREQNDLEKLREVQQELMALHAPMKEARDQMERDLHDGIVKILKPDQVTAFEAAWNEEKAGRGPSTAAAGTVRHLRRVVMSLDLSTQQREAVEEAFREHRRRERTAGKERGADEAGDAKSLEALRAAVEQHLNDVQKEALRRQMIELSPRSREVRRLRGEGATTRPAAGG